MAGAEVVLLGLFGSAGIALILLIKSYYKK